jgi:aminoglycoside 2'-N-acetyltransferase I
MPVKQSVVGGFLLQVGHTSEFDGAVLARARELLYVVFDDITEDDWQHSLGGMHAIVWHDDAIVGHASVDQRRLIHLGTPLRTGYVEGVGVHPTLQGRGIGGHMMTELESIVAGAYELGALGASDAAVDFYTHRGWIPWKGRSFALTPDGVVRTPDEDDGIFVWPLHHPIDVDGDITCDWRDGDVW